MEVEHLHISEEGPNQPGAKGGDGKSATIEKPRVLDRMISYTQRKGESWKWKPNAELVTVQDNLTGKPDAGTEPATCEANLHVRFNEGEYRDWPFRRPAFSTLLVNKAQSQRV